MTPRHPANDVDSADRITPPDPLMASTDHVDDSTEEERAPEMPTRHNTDGLILLPTPQAIFAKADQAAEEATRARAAAVRASEHALSCSGQVGGMLRELATVRRHVDDRLDRVEGEVSAIGTMMRQMSQQQGLQPVHPTPPPPRDRPISYADLEPLLDDREKRQIGARFQKWTDKFAVAIVTGIAGALVAAVSTAVGWGMHELRHPVVTSPPTQESPR